MKNEHLIEEIFEKAKLNPQRIIFPEASDEKMLSAAYDTAVGGYGLCTLVGNTSQLKDLIGKMDMDESKFSFVDPSDENYRNALIERYMQLPDIKLSERSLIRKMASPLYFALVMQAVGDADVTIGGFDATTADMIQAALEIIGMEDGVETVSSVCLCEIPNFDGPEGAFLAMGDNAVCPDPSPSELASIAISSCDTISSLTGWQPRCAMLSFSTDGSACHDLVDKVTDALEIAKSRRPDLLIDGEFQVDTALIPEYAAKKLSRPSEVAGNANILIYPDLNAGNIGAKMLNIVAKAKFAGVFVQGFKQIITDSSRSASEQELVRNIVFSAVRAANQRKTQQADTI